MALGYRLAALASDAVSELAAREGTSPTTVLARLVDARATGSARGWTEDTDGARMTPTTFAARMAELAEGRAIVDEHLTDNEGLLIHLLMPDLLRECVRLFHAGDVETSSRILQLVDVALLQGDEALRNAVEVSFVEHAGYGPGETEAFLATWPQGLADELVRQRSAPDD